MTLEDILSDVKEAANSYGVAIRRADVKDLIFPSNLQGIMNRVLAAERNSEAQLVEARTRAEVEQIEAQSRAETIPARGRGGSRSFASPGRSRGTAPTRSVSRLPTHWSDTRRCCGSRNWKRCVSWREMPTRGCTLVSTATDWLSMNRKPSRAVRKTGESFVTDNCQ